MSLVYKLFEIRRLSFHIGNSMLLQAPMCKRPFLSEFTLPNASWQRLTKISENEDSLELQSCASVQFYTQHVSTLCMTTDVLKL